MRHKVLFVIGIVLLALLAGAVAASAREDDRDRGKAPSTVQLPSGSQTQPLSPVDTAFTYQGQLKDGGNPANGQYDFVFSLYDATNAGNRIGSPITVTNQTVTGGVIAQTLDFGAGSFQGEARWLEVAVRQTGGGSYTTLAPRQAITAVPNAMSLVPGATITSTSSSTLLTVNNSGSGTAVYGVSGTGYGVYGNSSTYGLVGTSTSSTGSGVWASNPNGDGVDGQTASSTGHGLTGYNSNISGGVGVYGNGVIGVEGQSTYNGTGVYGSGTTGVRAEGNTYGAYVSANTYGVYASGSYGVYALGNTGVYGSGGTGVYGSGSYQGVRAAGNTYGVYATSDDTGVYASGYYGVNGQGGIYGLYGHGLYGVYGYSQTGTGVYGESGNWAGWFQGSVNVTGNLYKGAGSFKIDHPLDPTNKYLYHSFVESPDMMNIYNGNVTLDAKGEATVTMPDWFEVLNMEFRYQLTAIDAPGPNLYVAEEMKNNHFKIAGGKAGMKVSWQVTDIRHDAYAEKHRIPVEENKPPQEKGLYLHPTEHGQPESKGIDYERTQQMRQQMNQPDTRADSRVPGR
jgi:hypothetical protein